jgi:uncharacterized membrane protein YkoI
MAAAHLKTQEASMLHTIRKGAVTVAALGALGLGGAALAGAADTTNTPNTSGARDQRQALPSDAAAKVKEAALAKVPGATVLETEAGGPYGSAYHAHIRTSDGARKVVLVNSSFEATGVQAERAGDGRGHGGPGRGGHADETPLTGDTKQKVEAAVRDRYAGATILRTETNGDSTAPYESHVRTSDGRELEVHVSKEFAIVDAREHPGHR